MLGLGRLHPRLQGSLDLPYELTVHRRSGMSLDCIKAVSGGGLDLVVTPIKGVARVLIYCATVGAPFNDT